MAVEQQVETLVEMAENGDIMASALLNDMAEERGMILDWRPGVGDNVFFFTGAFYYAGHILGEDHEYYSLAPGAVTVFESGPYDRLFNEGICGQCETVPYVSVIRKPPIAQAVKWELPVMPHRQDQKGVKYDAYKRKHKDLKAWFPGAGDKAFFFTGAFYYCGEVLSANFDSYCMKGGTITVFETGNYERLFKDGVCGQCEAIPHICNLRKSPIAQVVRWEHKELPRRQER